jgi:hypothetical protein
MATMKKAQWGERVGRAKGQKCGLEKAFRKEERMYEKENRRADRQADREAKREARRGPRMRNGGTAKKGGSFPDLTGDGKVTRADVLKGRGVIKNGKSVKKARGGATLSPSGSNVSKRLSSYPKTIGKAMNGTTTPMQRRARVAAAIGREAASKRKSRTAARPMMKHGGKAHMKKAMGGYKMMQTGGKCRGGCY